MIKFEIQESLNFRGGNHYCYAFAKSPDDLFESIKDAWYGSGLARHGGELFVSAHLIDADENEVKLFFGNCTVDKRNNLNFNFTYLSEEDCEPWFCFGLFAASETDDYESILDDLFDFDSPDRVVGSFLFRAWKKIDDLPANVRATFNESAIACILDFGKGQGKLIEIWSWIFSNEGVKYFDQLEYSLDMSEPEIVKLGGATDVNEIEAFIKKYKKDFGITMYLPSSL